MRYLIYILLFTITANAQLQSVSYWAGIAETEYQAQIDFYDDRYDVDANGRMVYNPNSASLYNNPRIWDNELVLMVCTRAIEIIDDRVWMDRMMHHMDELQSIAVGRSENGTTYYDWPLDGSYSQTLNDSRGKRSIFRFLRTVKNNPVLLAYMGETNWQNYYDWWSKNILDKWLYRGCSSIMRTKVWMSSHYAFMSWHASKIETDPVKKAEYEGIYKAFWGDGTDLITWCPSGSAYYGSGDDFRAQWRDRNGGYVYSGDWGNMTTYGDADHNNASMELLIDMYDEGYLVSESDYNKFDTTLNNMFDASPDSATDFLRFPYDTSAVWSSGNSENPTLYYGWVFFGGGSDITQEKLERTATNFPSGIRAKSTWYMNLAYNRAKATDAIIYPVTGSSIEPEIPVDELLQIKRKRNQQATTF